MTTTRPKIIIAGAGLAGLSLAQGLKQHKIAFHVFERDTSASFRAQGYRVRISFDGADALRKLLPQDLFAAFEATCAGVIPGGRHIDAISGLATQWANRGPAARVMGDSHISFGKRLDGYKVCGDGRIQAHFADGSTEEGSLLIGADGIWSPVRKPAMSDFELLDTGTRAVFGKTPITDSLPSLVPAEIMRGICVIGESQESRIKLFCDTMKFDRSVDSNAGVSFGLSIPNDYIYWVLLFPGETAEQDDAKLMSFSGDASAKLSEELISKWHGSIRAILSEQDPAETSTLMFLTTTPASIQSAARDTNRRNDQGLVVLIGDAAHPMPPVGGVGANLAFQDAAGLLDALLGIDAGAARAELISTFESEMCKRASVAVERSIAGAGGMFGMRPMADMRPVRRSVAL